MKKFLFKLQRVIDVKKSIEKKKMQELAEAKRHVKIEKKKLEKLIDNKIRYITMFNELKESGPINASDANQILRYIDKLRKDIEKQKDTVEIKIKEAGRRRNDLVETVKDKKILEKLRENKLVDYNKDVIKEEQTFLDEVGAVKSARGELIKINT
ncbi:flagellar export protein FliJ [bacterium]|nr:flagellar export protein FliJ [bacterium]